MRDINAPYLMRGASRRDCRSSIRHPRTHFVKYPRRIDQPHEKSTPSLERFNGHLDPTARALRQPDVSIVISFFVVLVEGDRKGRVVREKAVEKLNGEIARQTAVAEQAPPKLVLFG